jgi:hypothetical protein
MKLLVAVLLLIALPFALAAAIPILSVGLAFGAVLGCLFVWFLPILIIATSDRTTGAEKLAWILAIVFLSWFAWIFYALLAPIKERPYDRDYRGYRDYEYREYRDRRYRYD